MCFLLRVGLILILSVGVGFIAEGGGKSADPSVEDLIKEADAIVTDGKGKVLERLHKLHANYEGFGFSGFVPTEDKNEQIADVLIQCIAWRYFCEHAWNYIVGQVGDQLGRQVWSHICAQVLAQLGGGGCDQFDQVCKQIWDQACYQVGDQGCDQCINPFIVYVVGHVWEGVWNHIWDLFRDQVANCGLVDIEKRLQKFDFASAHREGKLQELVGIAR